MPFTYDMNLPSEEELTVTEINLSMAALFAGSQHLGKVCESQNNEFILCRTELDDPRKCIKEGKDVTKCALDFFREIKKECREEFEQFAKCLHKSSSNWDFDRCRKTQAVFDSCVLDKLGIERPPCGWYSEIHIHKTEREKPENKPLVFPDAPVPFTPVPEDKKKPGKHGFRNYL